MRKVLLLSILGFSAGAAVAPGQTPTPSPASAWVTSQSVPITFPLRPSYSAARAQDLVFATVLLPSTPGEHQLGLRLYTPRGHLYQTLTVSFTVPTPPASKHALPPLPVLLTARLPIADTPIVESSLYGSWRAVPHLDAAAEPCGRAHDFEITP
jgi:hypothetical protein